jgi:hypothetical protein
MNPNRPILLHTKHTQNIQSLPLGGLTLLPSVKSSTVDSLFVNTFPLHCTYCLERGNRVACFRPCGCGSWSGGNTCPETQRYLTHQRLKPCRRSTASAKRRHTPAFLVRLLPETTACITRREINPIVYGLVSDWPTLCPSAIVPPFGITFPCSESAHHKPSISNKATRDKRANNSCVLAP